MKIISPFHAIRGVCLCVMVVSYFIFVPWLSVGAATSGDLVTTYCDIKGDECRFTLVANSKKLKYPHVELSLDKDFSRVKYLFALKKGSLNYEYTLKSEDIEAGVYYWRAADATGAMVEPADGTRMEFGSAQPGEYSVKTDPTFYDDVELSDETELSLESIWLRTEKNDARIEWANAPYCGKMGIFYEPSTDYTNNHGMVVRGNTIYVSRGSYYVSSWKYDKKQVWIDRYDLATGATLPMLRVRQDSGDDYPDYDLMTLIGEDADGTVYFTSSIVWSSDGAAGNKIRLYTVDLDNVVTQDGCDVVLSKLEGEFTVPVTPDYMRYCMVSGSIKSKDYYLWGAAGSNDSEVRMNNLEVPVYRWHYVDGSVTVRSCKITDFSHSEVDPMLHVLLQSPKIVPVSEDKFYFQAIPAANDVLFSPTLYAVPEGSDNICQLQTSLTDAPKGMQNTLSDSPIGVSVVSVGGKPVLAYGRRNERGSSVQLAELPETFSFAGVKPLWNINPQGFSDTRIQGCNAAYIPDDGQTSDGRLVVYVPNGGLGLYKLSAKGTTVGIDEVEELSGLRVSGRTVYLPRKCADVRIVDMSGRDCLRIADSSVIDASALSPGVYFVVTPSLTKTHKIILK